MTFEGSAGSSAIDNILISDRSIIRDAQVVETIRMMDTHTPNAELTEYDSKTPHNMVIAYVNLHTLPEHILLIPADTPPQATQRKKMHSTRHLHKNSKTIDVSHTLSKQTNSGERSK
jgi:hypothetical protein